MRFPIIATIAFLLFFFLSAKPKINPAKFIPNVKIILIANQTVSSFVRPNSNQNVAIRNVRAIIAPPKINKLIDHNFPHHYIFLLYCPPTLNRALVISPIEAYLHVSINCSKRLSF